MSDDLLQPQRDAIDAIDEQIVRLLGERWRKVEEVSAIKQLHNLPPLQANRFDEMLEELKKLEITNGLPKGMLDELWHVIHKYSRRSQGEVDAN